MIGIIEVRDAPLSFFIVEVVIPRNKSVVTLFDNQIVVT
jgi:hypothetical protein